MALYSFYKEQRILASKEIVWDFISSPQNLERITPENMQFRITLNNLPTKIYPGMIISYSVKPELNIKMNWVSEITQVKENDYFIDDQRVGPYKIWHHEHKIMPIEGGTLMIDSVLFQPPLGAMGIFANKLFIKNNLHKIFNYREMALTKIFGKFE